MPVSTETVLQSAEARIAGLGAPATMRTLLHYPLRKAALQLERDPCWPVLHLPSLLSEAYRLPTHVAIDLSVSCLILYGFADLTDDAQDGDLQGDWGWERAINAGNALAFLGSEVLLSLDLPADVRSRLTAAYAAAGRKMTFGQESDLHATYPYVPPVAEYLEMVSGKSGESVAFFVSAPAIAAGEPPETIHHLTRFGQSLGSYLQLLSDVSDITQDESSDLRNRKITLPLIYALGQSDEARTILQKVLENRATTEELQKVLTRTGALAYCRMKAQVQKRTAEAALEALELDGAIKSRLSAYFEAPSPSEGWEI